jgi:Putative transmembrane protein (PGPGW)
MPAKDHVRRVTMSIVGGVVFLIGVALLVLPGPGLLLVLAGLIILAGVFPTLERHVDPVRERAMKAAEDSVSSPLRIAGSVVVGLSLLACGVIWGLKLFPWLPFAGWSTGTSLILSGVVLFGLLGWSYRKVQTRADPPPRR